jgi:hypothetical protein
LPGDGETILREDFVRAPAHARDGPLLEGAQIGKLIQARPRDAAVRGVERKTHIAQKFVRPVGHGAYYAYRVIQTVGAFEKALARTAVGRRGTTDGAAAKGIGFRGAGVAELAR